MREGSIQARCAFAIPAVPSQIGTARQRSEEWLGSIAVHDGLRSDIVLAVSELVTNAVKASPGPASPVEVLLTLVDNRVCVEVTDQGSNGVWANQAGRDRSLGALPANDSFAGRGLPIVTHLAEVVDVQRSSGRTIVTARFAL